MGWQEGPDCAVSFSWAMHAMGATTYYSKGLQRVAPITHVSSNRGRMCPCISEFDVFMAANLRWRGWPPARQTVYLVLQMTSGYCVALKAMLCGMGCLSCSAHVSGSRICACGNIDR
jgi:hypothetical protein